MKYITRLLSCFVLSCFLTSNANALVLCQSYNLLEKNQRYLISLTDFPRQERNSCLMVLIDFQRTTGTVVKGKGCWGADKDGTIVISWDIAPEDLLRMQLTEFTCKPD